MASCLEKIPSEIHRLIGGHLRIRDLNSVCCTCHTLNHGFLANLYKCVVIKVPIRWSRLVSLENLNCSAGLKFTTSIRIIAQQQPLDDDILDSEDGRTAREIEEEKKNLFCLPQISASKALNVMIRLLIMRVPKNQLKFFHWLHSCSLETSTLTLLLEHQGATLRELSITRYSEPQNLSSSLVGGLQQLAITDLNIKQSCEWPSKLIAHNCHTLRKLHLGIMNTIARHYPEYSPPNQRRLPASFSEAAKGAIPADEQKMMPMLSLEELGLYGLSLKEIARGALGLEIDFNSMTALKLDSCHGLEDAFPLLTGKTSSQSASQSVLKLTSFFVRHKNRSRNLAHHLANFLTSFTGLKHLVLLLEGRSQAMSKTPILEMHGITLQTLVWDERRGPGNYTKTDTSLNLKKSLLLISLKCPNMMALGLPMPWVSLQANSFLSLEEIARWMPKLRTFHCRNLPEINLTGSFLPREYMVKSLASVILDSHARGISSSRQNPLTTIALGAPVYSDIHIGSNHIFRDPVRDYLQLRVYHVDYKYQSVLGPSPTITQVAKGIAGDAAMCHDKDLLNEYWLA